ncbi:EAL domain-containing protein [Dechloromonas sp. ZY10]|uniref:putative bifunctional diguanylate cyclase/phosphodiesterase n=1 Tax=Dechloromonas aquae TaxID=2664436 RepID=UPI003529CC8A
MHKGLQRQLKRGLGIADQEACDRLLAEAVLLARQPGVSGEMAALLCGLNDFLQRVEASYEQADRDLELRTRSLELSSAELNAANSKLRADVAARSLLHEAVRNIAIGFTIYDPEDRLVMCNEAYLGFYEDSRDLIVPGATFEEIVRRGAERGQYKQAIGRVDAWVAERVWQHQHPDGRAIEQELADGRWLLIIEYRTPGGYLVGNRIDITASKQADKALRLYANIFENSGEAILVCDRDNLIVDINPAFSRLTGYCREEVLGQDPKLLASGSTPPHIYQEMWATLRDTGYWQGELWDRRKDGGLRPVWAAISVIRDELGEIANYIASFTDISERKAAEERIAHLAHHDPLTGLFNRFSLEERLDQALLSARRERQQVAVMFIDMDRFKLINDTLGHHIGDRLLIEVARRLQDCVRESDIVARLGGDEFVVVLTGAESGMQAGATIAQRILQRLDSPYLIDGKELRSTPSIGISVYPGDGESAEELMQHADVAMYHVKECGRNAALFFTPEMNTSARERMSLERDMLSGLAEGQFELHYQPQIEAASSRICGVEALVRWRHPVRGMLSPLEFIPLAEETGMIEPLGSWVLAEACRQLAEWQQAGCPSLRMAVNLSAFQLRSGKLIEEVGQLLAQYRIASGHLELEVTESVAMANPERAIGLLLELRNLGVELAIDDFGTGYSSLAYLKLLPIDTLKLDRTFVKDIESDGNDAAISAATIALAHNLGLKVIAEGVETIGQEVFLLAHACDILQGYRYSRPAPAAAIAALLREGRPVLGGEP